MSAPNTVFTQSTDLDLLVVDDEPMVLKSIKRAVRPAGYRVHTAQNGREAMDILANFPIAVVLTDHRMPGMTGADLLKYIHEFYPQTITLMLSAESDFSMAVGLLNSGLVNKYLTKPWSSSQLVTEIEQAFGYFKERRENGWRHRITQLSTQLESDTPAQPENVVTLNKSGAFVVVKLVNMEDISYSHGGSIMEQLLDEIEQQIRAMVGTPCHLRQDQFGLFSFQFPQKGSEKLENWCMSLRQTLQKTYVIDNRAVYGQIGVGFTLVATPHVDLNTLTKNLELTILKEMHARQVTNLDCLTIERYKRQQHICADVQNGLDNNQFKLAYQPKVDLRTGMIKGAEILLRWQHHQLGWVPPAEFVRIAELDGQIEAIGEWVLRQSVRAVSELVRFSEDIRKISINVSAKQLQNLHIVHVLKEEIARYSVNPACIELEVTETAVASNSEFVRNLLWQLKLLGVNIAIDDFGAGFTSMSYLARLPVDVLKLDKSLVDNIDTEINSKELIRSLIDTCKRLHIESVAEGVETKAVLNVLRELGCDQVQGFYYSKAVPREDFEKLVIQQPFRTMC
ncbi:EAL domain-containing protein [Alteromonas sp. C1M14]|uniref:EAL domain-containing response regulator n=1 Tax=Alteromonas sp. C1M14 TaxID=2841567 RepID=UPI001C097308|nr:EAL domain-containing protein [Alteromonas sp. C1M14]MBU2977275.1 EAL domain-containing protein [Alteromonas sp. C1M14]